MEVERILIALLLVAGFIWLRGRIRSLNDERRPRALYGSFVLLAAGLIAGKWLFGRLPFGGWGSLLVELGGLVALFAVTAAIFTPFGRGRSGGPSSSGPDARVD